MPQRNYALDVLKCIAALMIVFLHYNRVEGEYGILYSDIMRSITRVAVPLFFMITGYYLPVIAARCRLFEQIRKVLVMALCSSLFYFSYRLVDAYFNESLMEWLTGHYTPSTIFVWLVFNDAPSGYHLWYLYALLYSLLFYAAIYKVDIPQYIPHITIALFCVVLVANYTDLIFVRNYFLGIPCIGCGVMIREGVFRIPYRKVLFVVSLFLVIAEMLIVKYYLGKTFDVYTFSIPLALCLLTWAIDNPQVGENTVWATIGLKYSAYIYILHVFVDNMIGRVISYDTTVLQLARPFIVFVITLLFSIILVKIKNNYETRGL